MNLIDALESLRTPAEQGTARYAVHLASGFTPLHLQTFLSAHLRKALPLRSIEVRTGLYGDLKGNVRRLEAVECDAIAVIVEWQDLDSRLGIRNLGGWLAKDLREIVDSVKAEAQTLDGALRLVSRHAPTAVCLPTLPLPPLFSTAPGHSGEVELALRQIVAQFACSLAGEPGMRIVSVQELDARSPMHERFDAKSEILFGFPYKVNHASVVGEALASLIQPAAPKKGIITDLDDTLWAGLVGESGTGGVSWHLEDGAHVHGLYQQFLASLASSGALVGIASKNDALPAQEALERKDILLKKESVYPIAASWRAKSESVREILRVWNVAPDSVVFIDDSPLEVAEVKAAYPEMECIVFPRSDYQALWLLLRRLRGLFGKPFTSEEDRLRLKSIRDASGFRDSSGSDGRASDDFLATVKGSVTFSVKKSPTDRRSLELINKTNQFNLNGRRLTESEWLAEMANPATVLIGANYQDKFGSLGKIGVLLGRKEADTFFVERWVISCRAFSRRIEYQMAAFVFESMGAGKIAFRYEATSRNKVLQDFFKELLGREPLPEDLMLSREVFHERCPALFHQVSVDD